jgi:hypothetical protein
MKAIWGNIFFRNKTLGGEDRLLNSHSVIRNSGISVCPTGGRRLSTNKTHYFIFFLTVAFLTLCALPEANAKDLTIGWDANKEPDLEGYVVYRNVDAPGPPYDYSDTLPEDELANPLHPKATLTGLKEDRKYHVALTAYNTKGVESSFSNDLCVKVVNGIAELCSQGVGESAQVSSGSSGGGGWACFISTTSKQASLFIH